MFVLCFFLKQWNSEIMKQLGAKKHSSKFFIEMMTLEVNQKYKAIMWPHFNQWKENYSKIFLHKKENAKKLFKIKISINE